jgi:hypothetical protein
LYINGIVDTEFDIIKASFKSPSSFPIFVFYLFVIKLFLQTTDDNSQEVKIPNKDIRRESLKVKSGFKFAG